MVCFPFLKVGGSEAPQEKCRPVLVCDAPCAGAVCSPTEALDEFLKVRTKRTEALDARADRNTWSETAALQLPSSGQTCPVDCCGPALPHKEESHFEDLESSGPVQRLQDPWKDERQKLLSDLDVERNRRMHAEETSDRLRKEIKEQRMVLGMKDEEIYSLQRELAQKEEELLRQKCLLSFLARRAALRDMFSKECQVWKREKEELRKQLDEISFSNKEELARAQSFFKEAFARLKAAQNENAILRAKASLGQVSLVSQPKIRWPPGADERRAAGGVYAEMSASSHRPLVERRKTHTALCAQWHPDKNQGKEDLATEVFKFLQTMKAVACCDFVFLAAPR
eukprot:s54_g18.t3